MARCVGRSLDVKPFDPVQLQLQHLSSNAAEGNYPLIAKTRELVSLHRSSPLTDAARWVTILARKYLFSASRSISQYNYMVAAAWAFNYLASGKQLPEPGEDKDLDQPLISFLFWTAALGSRAYGRSRFDREAFRKAWSAGKAGKVFPYHEMQGLCYDIIMWGASFPWTWLIRKTSFN